MLYHGSKISGIQTLKPSPHDLVRGDAVVFATFDIRFALAMIHAVDDVVGVGYVVDTRTGHEVMYLEERVPGGFKTLARPGVTYTVSSEGFVHDHRLSHAELVSSHEAPVRTETYVPNVLDALREYDIDFVAYGESRDV